MSVPASLMQQMMKQGGTAPGAAPPPAAGAAREMAPAAAPFATPQDKKGLKATAMSNVHIALTMLEQALPDLGAESEEGQSVVKALHVLAKLAGKRDNSDLVPAEIMQMVKSLPQMGGGTQIQQELAKQQAEQRMAGMRGQGAAPGGASAPIPGVMQ